MPILRSTLILLLVLQSPRALAQVEILFDDPSGGFAGWQGFSEVLSDGSMIALSFWFMQDDEPYYGHAFKHISASGSVIGSYYLPDVPEGARLRNHGDGYLISYRIEPEGMGYSVLNENDQVTLAKKVLRSSSVLSNTDVLVRSAAGVGGDTYLVFLYWFSGQQVVEVLRSNSDGELIWARNVGDPALAYEDVPAFADVTFLSDAEILVDALGHAYILINSAGKAQIMKISPAGELEWALELAQTVNTHYHAEWSMEMDDLDRLHLAVYRDNDLDAATVFFALSQGGELQRAERYASVHLPVYYKRYLTLHNGRRYFSGYAVVETDTLGSPGALHFAQSPAREAILSFHGDTSITYAVYPAIPVPGTTMAQEVFIKMPDGSLNSCYFAPEEMPHANAEDEYTLTPMGNYSSFDVTSDYQVSDHFLTIETRTIPESHPLCPFIVGVEEHTAAQPADPVITTLLPAGTPITLKDGISGAIIIHSSDGREIYSATVSPDSNSIATSGWSAGLYFIRVLNGHGYPLGFSRVLIH